jgi:sulfate adenylyltransferase subunit 1
MSALNGDNVVTKSTKIDWYKGETLLEHLEKTDAQDVFEKGQVRFPVQSVIRPKMEQYHDFRGYAGKLYGDDLSVGETITVLPSMTQTKVKEIHFFNETFDKAERGSSITITLENDVNVSRGDMLVKSNELPTIAKELNATICWMDKQPLTTSGKYRIQHGTNIVTGKIERIDAVLSTDYSGEKTGVDNLQINEIGNVALKFNKPLLFDSYAKNKSNGAFILIDANSNTTAGVGFIN